MSAHNIEHSSAEFVSIADNANATYLRDVYVKSGNEESSLCSVVSMVCVEKTRVVVVDVAEQQDSCFAYSEAAARRMFRVKLFDTKLNLLVGEVKVPGQFKGMAKINESQVAIWLDGYKMILLKVGTTLTIDRCLRFDLPHDFNDYDVTDVAYIDDHLYVCRGLYCVSKFNIKGKVTEKRIQKALHDNKYHHFIRYAMYENGNKIFMYAIVRDGQQQLNSRGNAYIYAPDGPAYLTHGTIKVIMGKTKIGEMDTIKLPGEPKSITMDDLGELLIVLLYSGTSFKSIYVLRAGTSDGRVVLSEEDGLRHVTAVFYCSKTRELFVAMEESNYVKVYQLSGVP